MSVKCLGKVGKNNEIVAKIKNMMSARHIVQKKLNELLQTYRREVLPTVVRGWGDVT